MRIPRQVGGFIKYAEDKSGKKLRVQSTDGGTHEDVYLRHYMRKLPDSLISENIFILRILTVKYKAQGRYKYTSLLTYYHQCEYFPYIGR